MKYIDLKTVVESYKGFQDCMTNKSWGYLALLKGCNSSVRPSVPYEVDLNKVSNFLENIFNLAQIKKQYEGGHSLYVVFSNIWESFFNNQGKASPNIFDVIAWAYRRKAFQDDITKEEIIKLFSKEFNIPSSLLSSSFNTKSKDIVFSDTLYSESELKTELSKNGVDVSKNNIDSKKGGIVASPGEITRGPFIQPLYAALDITDYVIILQSNYYSLYGDNEKTSEVKAFSPLQKIYYGTPGSGKSHKVKEIVEGLYPEEQDRDKYVFRTTFHPDSDYASFVGCYKPQMDGTGDIKYEFTPQAFTNAYARAWKESGKQVYLVIEEINRGNCAQIFGDLFQLLDRKGGVSEYPINADTDLRQYLEKDDILGKGHEGIANGKLKLPANLNIVATMNTSDQSLFPMDSAFKRRWSWECVPINYDDDKSGAFAITIGNSRYKWLEFLKAVNKKIFKATDSEDKQMGNFFINGDVDKRQFIDKVMFYLWNDICKEEYRSTNNFFRNYVDDKKIETTEFSFNELFGTNAETLLKGFMVFLGVEPIQSEGDASVTETKTD